MARRSTGRSATGSALRNISSSISSRRTSTDPLASRRTAISREIRSAYGGNFGKKFASSAIAAATRPNTIKIQPEKSVVGDATNAPDKSVEILQNFSGDDSKIILEEISTKLNDVFSRLERIDNRLSPKNITVGKEGQRQTYRYDPLAPEGKKVTVATASGKSGRFASKKESSAVLSKAAYLGNPMQTPSSNRTGVSVPKNTYLGENVVNINERIDNKTIEKISTRIASQTVKEIKKTLIDVSSTKRKPITIESTAIPTKEINQTQIEMDSVDDRKPLSYQDYLKNNNEIEESEKVLRYGGRGTLRPFLFGATKGLVGEELASKISDRFRNKKDSQQAFERILDVDAGYRERYQTPFKPSPSITTEVVGKPSVNQVPEVTSLDATPEIQPRDPAPVNQIPTPGPNIEQFRPFSYDSYLDVQDKQEQAQKTLRYGGKGFGRAFLFGATKALVGENIASNISNKFRNKQETQEAFEELSNPSEIKIKDAEPTTLTDNSTSNLTQNNTENQTTVVGSTSLLPSTIAPSVTVSDAPTTNPDQSSGMTLSQISASEEMQSAEQAQKTEEETEFKADVVARLERIEDKLGDVEVGGGSGGGILDSIMDLTTKFGGISKMVGGLTKVAAPLAAGLAVFQGVDDLLEGKKVESIGDVVPEGMNKLNPFAWAMRGGMYVGEKFNQGYKAVVGEELGDTIFNALNPEAAETLKRARAKPGTVEAAPPWPEDVPRIFIEKQGSPDVISVGFSDWATEQSKVAGVIRVNDKIIGLDDPKYKDLSEKFEKMKESGELIPYEGKLSDIPKRHGATPTTPPSPTGAPEAKSPTGGVTPAVDTGGETDRDPTKQRETFQYPDPETGKLIKAEFINDSKNNTFEPVGNITIGDEVITPQDKRYDQIVAKVKADRKKITDQLKDMLRGDTPIENMNLSSIDGIQSTTPGQQNSQVASGQVSAATTDPETEKLVKDEQKLQEDLSPKIAERGAEIPSQSESVNPELKSAVNREIEKEIDLKQKDTVSDRMVASQQTIENTVDENIMESQMPVPPTVINNVQQAPAIPPVAAGKSDTTVVIAVRNLEPSVSNFNASIFDHPVTHPGLYTV